MRIDRLGSLDMTGSHHRAALHTTVAGFLLLALGACGTTSVDAVARAAEPSTAASVPAPTPTPPPTLRPGDKGEEVRKIQQQLSDLGYWLGKVNGSFGNLTTQAVYAVQTSAGLEPTGIIDEATRFAIDQGVLPDPRSNGDAIEIDKERKVLMIVRGGKPVTVHHTSTGSNVPYAETVNGITYTGDAFTPPGTFQVFRDINGNDAAPLGNMWRPKYFNNGIAVHGYDDVPTTGASHGCARLTKEAMDRIWEKNLMPIGSTVIVY